MKNKTKTGVYLVIGIAGIAFALAAKIFYRTI